MPAEEWVRKNVHERKAQENGVVTEQYTTCGNHDGPTIQKAIDEISKLAGPPLPGHSRIYIEGSMDIMQVTEPY